MHSEFYRTTNSRPGGPTGIIMTLVVAVALVVVVIAVLGDPPIHNPEPGGTLMAPPGSAWF